MGDGFTHICYIILFIFVFDIFYRNIVWRGLFLVQSRMRACSVLRCLINSVLCVQGTKENRVRDLDVEVGDEVETLKTMHLIL